MAKSFGRERPRRNRARSRESDVHCAKLTDTLPIRRRDLSISYRLGSMIHASTVNEVVASTDDLTMTKRERRRCDGGGRDQLAARRGGDV